MASQSSEFTRKLRGAVRAKIEEYGIEVDDELPDYVMILVGNKKDKARMKSDLKLFLGDNTSDFVEWLFGFFQKVKASGSGTANAGSQPMPKDKSVTIEEAIEEKKKSSNVDKVPAETHSQKKSSSKQHKPRKAELPEAKAPEMRSSKADSKELRSSSKYDRNRKEQRQRPADEASNKRTTIKPILRSVVVQPIHPRIRPRSRSPAPMVICSGLAPNDERNLPAAHPHKVIENEEHPKRRVVATSSGSMLFQRAARALIQTDNEAKTGTGTSHKELDEAKKKKQPENDEMVEALEEKETEKPRAEEDKASMAIINEKKQEQQQQTRMPLAPKMKDRKGPPLVGIGAIFQRAIQQTQNQNEPIKGGGGQQLPMVSERRKRIFDNEQIKESTSKKIRIEFEEIEEQPTEEEENNEEEGSVLVVNMSRPATRSIRKEPRKPPKSGLALLKQHIGVPEELTAGKMEKQTNSLSEVPGTNGKYEKEHGPSSSAQNPNIITTNLNITTAAAPLWNDQFKIDDMSSTDDEAEIDAVLEEQHQLKRMALERESELKGRELPPTSALTRPMHYNEIPTSVQVQPLLSPGEADLLPAIFQPQNLTNLSQKPPLSISTRPFATVAPCSTTTAAPITMFVHQQYQQQNQTFMPQQFVYAPSPAIYMPIPQRPMNRFQTKGSFSKVYSAQVPAMTGKGPLAKAGHDEKLRQLREQHKQMVLKYSKSLEEQRLILAQLKKMSGNPQAEQTVQTLKFRCKKMDAIAKEMKQKLEAMSEEISSLTKQEDSQQIDLASTGSLEMAKTRNSKTSKKIMHETKQEMARRAARIKQEKRQKRLEAARKACLKANEARKARSLQQQAMEPRVSEPGPKSSLYNINHQELPILRPSPGEVRIYRRGRVDAQTQTDFGYVQSGFCEKILASRGTQTTQEISLDEVPNLEEVKRLRVENAKLRIALIKKETSLEEVKRLRTENAKLRIALMKKEATKCQSLAEHDYMGVLNK